MSLGGWGLEQPFAEACQLRVAVSGADGKFGERGGAVVVAEVELTLDGDEPEGRVGGCVAEELSGECGGLLAPTLVEERAEEEPEVGVLGLGREGDGVADGGLGGQRLPELQERLREQCPEGVAWLVVVRAAEECAQECGGLLVSAQRGERLGEEEPCVREVGVVGEEPPEAGLGEGVVAEAAGQLRGGVAQRRRGGRRQCRLELLLGLLGRQAAQALQQLRLGGGHGGRRRRWRHRRQDRRE